MHANWGRVMKFAHRKLLNVVGAAALPLFSWMASAGDVQAQSRTIKIIVPFAAGGGGSVLARLLADQIERQQGVATVVENKPGAGTVLGTEAVARAAPDGSIILITNTAIVTNPLLRPQNYDPLTSFEPVCDVASGPNFITVNSASPYHTLADFLNAARAAPAQLTVATFAGTSAHIGPEELKHVANVDLTFVPFPGSTPAVTALLGGHVTALFDNYAAVAEHVNAGKLRVLATAWPTRVEALPNIPTIAEAGYQGYGITSWWGSFVPAHTPKATITQLASWFTAASQVPEVKNKLAPLGFYSTSVCGPDFVTLVRKTYDDFGRAIREANIKVEQ
jgi:tripartite-type tricarboxylate transporter receptor subunit TctC